MPNYPLPPGAKLAGYLAATAMNPQARAFANPATRKRGQRLAEFMAQQAMLGRRIPIYADASTPQRNSDAPEEFFRHNNKQILTGRETAANIAKYTVPAGHPRKQSFIDRLSNAMLFNVGDDIAQAGVAALGGGAIGTYRAIKNHDIGEIPRTVTEEFQEMQRIQAAQERAFERENPRQAAAADFAGSIIGGGKVGGAFSGGKTLLGQSLRGLAGGASSAAVFGFGSEHGGLDDRLRSAGKAALIGGPFGAIIPGFSKVAGELAAKPIGDALVRLLPAGSPARNNTARQKQRKRY